MLALTMSRICGPTSTPKNMYPVMSGRLTYRTMSEHCDDAMVMKKKPVHAAIHSPNTLARAWLPAWWSGSTVEGAAAGEGRPRQKRAQGNARSSDATRRRAHIMTHTSHVGTVQQHSQRRAQPQDETTWAASAHSNGRRRGDRERCRSCIAMQ